MKKITKKNKKSVISRIGPKGLFIAGVVIVLTILGVIVSQLQTKGYKSKAAEVQVNCKQLCDEKLPNHMTYTDDCAAKIAAGTTEPCGCEKACLKVVKAVNGGMTCEEACKSQLRVMRGTICVNLLCPVIKNDPPQNEPLTEEETQQAP